VQKTGFYFNRDIFFSFIMVGINPLPEHLILKYQSAVGRSPTNYQTMPSSNWIKQEKEKKSFFKV